MAVGVLNETPTHPECRGCKLPQFPRSVNNGQTHVITRFFLLLHYAHVGYRTDSGTSASGVRTGDEHCATTGENVLVPK